jgi:hypothetical protein
MSETHEELVKMCMAASYDERLSDGMLYRKAAAALSASAERIAQLEAALKAARQPVPGTFAAINVEGD